MLATSINKLIIFFNLLERTYGRSFSIIEAYVVHMGASKQAVAEGQGNDLPPIPDERAQENLVLDPTITL